MRGFVFSWKVSDIPIGNHVVWARRVARIFSGPHPLSIKKNAVVYMFCSLKRLHCPDNNDTSFIANFTGIIEILNRTYEAVANPRPFSRDFSMASQDLVRTIVAQQPKPPPRNMIARVVERERERERYMKLYSAVQVRSAEL